MLEVTPDLGGAILLVTPLLQIIPKVCGVNRILDRLMMEG